MKCSIIKEIVKVDFVMYLRKWEEDVFRDSYYLEMLNVWYWSDDCCREGGVVSNLD